MNLAFQNAFFRMSTVLLLFLLMPLFISPSVGLAVSGPPQPSGGLGGTQCPYGKVISHSYGAGNLKYYVFEPDLPKPSINAPLIIFFHGWGATNPNPYSAWIEHITKNGNIVVFPVYQAPITKPGEYTGNAIRAVLSAIELLKSRNHVKPDLGRFAIVGHSCGGMVAANVAAVAEASGLPAPKLLMSVQPGLVATVPLEDLSKIPADTLLLTVTGDLDLTSGDRGAKKIFLETPQIPLGRKDFITMISDYHGFPPLMADHFAPASRADDVDLQAVAIPDALDYYCLWKLFDALIDAAFYGKNWEYALGNTPQQRYMGAWSDGTPIKEMIVTDNP
jgi:acetyl esterase/lipase